jgi:hypothetical protein
MSRKIYFAGLLLLVSILACNGQGFKGSAVTGETEEEAEPMAADEPPRDDANVEAAPFVNESIVDTVITEAPVIACKEKLNYDPSQILCSLKESENVTIWERTNAWIERVNSLKNPAASWISPLAAVNGAGNSVYCPFVPDSDRLIYVTNFTLTEDSDITIEAVIDDIGTVRIWKNADSKQEIYTSTKGPKVDGNIKLTKGFYSVVSDGIDAAQGATGMIMSIFDAKGGIIRQSEASANDWCIFRVKADTDIAAFVNSASSCRSCLIGNRANSKP